VVEIKASVKGRDKYNEFKLSCNLAAAISPGMGGPAEERIQKIPMAAHQVFLLLNGMRRSIRLGQFIVLSIESMEGYAGSELVGFYPANSSSVHKVLRTRQNN